jgi:hypothetical protein
MGFAEIQAAFAQNAQSTAQAAAQPMQVPAPVQPTPAPAAFQPQAAAPAFPTPSFAQPAAPAVGPLTQPVQGSFAFTPPAGFVPSSAPPINPPGERAALSAPELSPAVVPPPPTPAEPEPAKAKRGRKPRTDAAPTAATEESTDLTAAAIAALPHDGTSVERIVQELFARGVSSVHLTFTKEDK